MSAIPERESTTPEHLAETGRNLSRVNREKMERLYRDRRYTIAREVHLEDPQRFRTPFGHLGKHGYVLVSTDQAVLDDPDAGETARHIVGATLLNRIAREYGAVQAPPKRRPGRPSRVTPDTRADELDAARASTEAILGALSAALAD